MSIRIDKEFQALIPPLTDEEFKQLEENIVRDGIRDPLVVWHVPNGDDILIDGHNRWNIAAKHGGIHFEIKRMTFDVRDDVKAWIIQNQIGRRNLNTYNRSLLALELKPLIEKQAKKRQGTRTDRGNIVQKSARSRDELADIAKVSHDTIHKVETIEKLGDEATKQAVRNGDISINQAYLDVKGFTRKSPRQATKEFLEDTKRQREDFAEKKEDKVVSLGDIKQDEENAKILAREIWLRCMKIGKALDDFTVDMREGEIDLNEMLANISEENLADLKTAFKRWNNEFVTLFKGVFN